MKPVKTFPDLLIHKTNLNSRKKKFLSGNKYFTIVTWIDKAVCCEKCILKTSTLKNKISLLSF